MVLESYVLLFCSTFFVFFSTPCSRSDDFSHVSLDLSLSFFCSIDGNKLAQIKANNKP